MTRQHAPSRFSFPRRLGAAAIGLALCAGPVSAGAEAPAPAPAALGLEAVVALGLERNLDLKASRAGLAAGEWAARGSLLEFLPTGELTSRVTRVDAETLGQANQAQEGLSLILDGLVDIGLIPPGQVRIDPFLYRDSYRTQFTLNQQFPLNLHLLANQRLARRSVRALRHGVDAAEADLVYALRSSYLGALAAGELVEVAADNVASAENRNLLAAEREELGMIARDERLRWEVTLAQAKSGLALARSGAALARIELNRLLRLDLEHEPELEDVDESQLAAGLALAAEEPKRLVALAIERSPDAAALRAANGVNGAGEALALSGLVPSLHFSLTYGWRENDTIALDDYSTWSATALLRVPLFDLGRNAARWRQAAARKRMSDHQTAAALDGIRMAVHAAWLEARHARESLRHREAAERQAAETFALMEDRYGLGHITEFDLVEVQTALGGARALAIQARYEYYLALAALERTVGGGENTERRGG